MFSAILSNAYQQDRVWSNVPVFIYARTDIDFLPLLVWNQSSILGWHLETISCPNVIMSYVHGYLLGQYWLW